MKTRKYKEKQTFNSRTRRKKRTTDNEERSYEQLWIQFQLLILSINDCKPHLLTTHCILPHDLAFIHQHAIYACSSTYIHDSTQQLLANKLYTKHSQYHHYYFIPNNV